MSINSLDWKLAVHAFSFKKYSLEETLEKLSTIGVRYIELYPGQRVFPEQKLTSHFNKLKENEEPIKKLLAKYGIQAVAYGVVRGKDENEWKQIFEFAKAFSIQVLNIEPPYEQLPMIRKMAELNQIKVSIHNHPIPTPYWHPEIIKRQLDDIAGPWVGACCDIGHWVRSDQDPIDCIKVLDGHLFSFHVKDLKDFGTKSTHDVPWGTGVCNIAGVLHQLKKQGVANLVFSVEYEYSWDDNLREIEESIGYYYRVIKRMAKE